MTDKVRLFWVRSSIDELSGMNAEIRFLWNFDRENM